MKLTSTQIGYLAGLIDGEGSIYFSECSYKAKDGNRAYKTWVSVITNTNKALIDHVQKLLLDCGFTAKVRAGQPKGNSKMGYTIYITRMDQQYRFLKLMVEHLIAKGEQCELMLEFLEPRKDRVRGSGLRLDDVERLIVARVKHLNFRGTSKSVTTARATPESGMMIQSELHSDMQRVAEMTSPVLQ